jgi:outer membrane lipopolysaccharide assembly protein LptE/RlpB
MKNLLSFRQLIVIVASIGLAACGFRLAGTAELPQELSTIHLVTKNFSQQQQDELRGRLTRADAKVVDQATEDAVLLAVTFKVLPDRRVVSGGQSGKIVDRVARSLDFSLKSSTGEVIAAVKTLRQQKDIELDENNLLASKLEKTNVIKELEQALFKQLIIQLQRI